MQFSYFSVDSSMKGGPVSRKHTSIKDPVFKWFVQQRSSGVNVYSAELCSAGNTLTKSIWLLKFKGSDGGPCRFINTTVLNKIMTVNTA